jgi:hypothetical protein
MIRLYFKVNGQSIFYNVKIEPANQYSFHAVLNYLIKLYIYYLIIFDNIPKLY